MLNFQKRLRGRRAQVLFRRDFTFHPFQSWSPNPVGDAVLSALQVFLPSHVPSLSHSCSILRKRKRKRRESLPNHKETSSPIRSRAWGEVVSCLCLFETYGKGRGWVFFIREVDLFSAPRPTPSCCSPVENRRRSRFFSCPRCALPPSELESRHRPTVSGLRAFHDRRRERTSKAPVRRGR